MDYSPDARVILKGPEGLLKVPVAAAAALAVPEIALNDAPKRVHAGISIRATARLCSISTLIAKS